jgi:NAD(P)-dependent dehydrogenase (short-subunit alcohol dehydrogenase family)
MGIIAITGSGSGIGAATADALRALGHRVIGIDIGNADLSVDLSSADGRAQAVSGVLERCDGVLDGLVLCAGLGPQVEPPARIVSVNYFGAVELLDGLLPALSRGSNPAAVVVSSVSSTQISWDRNPLAAALEAGEEAALAGIVDNAGEMRGHVAYAGSKNAVTVAVRRRAIDWGRAGVRLNTVAPGMVETPLLQAGLDDARYGNAIRNFVAPLGRSTKPQEIAAMIVYLLSSQAGFVHGAQFVIDGGVDAMMRPTQF